MFIKLSLILASTLLFSLSANSNLSPTKIKSAISKAIRARDLNALDIIIDKNGMHYVDSNSVRWRGRNTLLHRAVAKGSPEIVEHLIKRGVLAHIRNRAGRTPLDDAIKSGKAAIVALLKNEINNDIRASARNGNVETIHHMMRLYDVDIDAPDEDGQTPLMIAAYWGNRKAIVMFLTNGADINAKDNNGQTTLMHAVSSDRGNVETAMWLIENAGADIHAEDDLRRNALEHAIWQGKQEMVDLLYEFDATTKRKRRGIGGGTQP